jgi:hypothetical protein
MILNQMVIGQKKFFYKICIHPNIDPNYDILVVFIFQTNI